MTFTEIIEELKHKRNLSSALMESALEEVFQNDGAEDQVRNFLVLLHQKGETQEEILGAVQYLLRQAQSTGAVFNDAVDCCGTGGDGQGTLNISTAVAFVLAGGGVMVAKHGNRAVSSISGSADVLKQLGVNIEMTPEKAVLCLRQSGITFLWAPQYYPILKKVAAVRKSIPHRTLFNLIGPLLNPLQSKRQLLGVYESRFVHLLAEVLRKNGSVNAVVVSSEDGLDEFSLTAKARMARLCNGQIKESVFDPFQESGYPRCDIAALKGGSPAENAQRLKKTLKGHSEPVDHVVHINAAWGFIVAGKCETFMDGLLMAQDAVSSGRAYRKLEELVELSHAC